MSTPVKPGLRVIALGQFAAEIPPLAPRLAALQVEPYRCMNLELLPANLNANDVLLTSLAWLNGLAPEMRERLCERAGKVAGWLALVDGTARFKDQVDWLRRGVSHFFNGPLDTERLASLLEDIHDRRHGAPPRVILLDDEASALDYYGETLRQAGIIVDATQDPLIVLDVIADFQPDLLLVDIEMPGCRGTELATIVRQRPEYARLPVIFLTAMEGMQDQLLARAAAGEDFLAKPVAPELLVTAVRSHVWRYRASLRAEAQHRREEARGRLRLEQLRMAIDEHAIVSMADVKGDIVYVNDKFCALSGYAREELLGQNHRMVKSGVHPPDFFTTLWNTITSGKVWHGEICNRRKNGELYWVEATIVPLLNSQGRPIQYISIRTDISVLKQREAEHRISDERLRRSQVFANIGTWDWDIRTGELYWSERIAPLFGHPTGELETSYENFLDAVHPDDRQAVIAAVNASVEHDAPYEIEHRVVWPDGQVRWLLERGAVIRDDNGKPLHMLGVVQDISDRKHAELAVAESEKKLADANRMLLLVLDNIPVRVFWKDTESRYLGCNQAFARDAGRSDPAEIVGLDDLAMPWSLEAESYRRDDRAVMASREPKLDYEESLLTPGGERIWLSTNKLPLLDAEEQLIGVLGVYADITERKAAEERLALFRRIFDASGQAVGITDSHGHIIYMNRAHEELLGYRLEEAAGRPFAIFFPEREQERIQAQVFAAANTGKGMKQQLLPLQRRDGTVFTSASNVGFVKNEHGEVQYLFNVFTDFSEELARRNELAQAKEVAERANQAKSDFLSSMSHELRTPMNAIIGFAQILEYDGALNADQQDNVYEILKASRHLLDLINEVLDLAKIESGRIDLSIEAIELAPLVEDCRQLIQPLAAGRQLSFISEVPHAIAVRADRVRLKQVLLNLLSNAVKYNRENGSIRLTAVRQEGNRIRIAVTDTGQGIAAERLSELFQPFNRLDAEQSEIEGTGIGLTITRRLMEMMGGEVGVTSEVGIGSTFWLELPVAQMTSHEATDSAAVSAHPPKPGQQQRVLCIDDNPANLKLITQMLGLRDNIDLVTAHTPTLGIELALAHRPALILLDINMPGMDGYQVLEVLRADPQLKHIPVVAVTANAMPRDIERGMAAGFAAYLVKPLDVELFLNTLDSCLTGGTTGTT